MTQHNQGKMDLMQPLPAWKKIHLAMKSIAFGRYVWHLRWIPITTLLLSQTVSLNARAENVYPLTPGSPLPQLTVYLQPGRQFDLRPFYSIEPECTWVRIPEWLAGLWYTKSETKTRNIDLPSGIDFGPIKFSRSDKHLFGMQEDRQGEIWHPVLIPRIHALKSKHFSEYRIEFERDFPLVTRDEVVTVCRFIAVRVANGSKQILSARQQESVLTIKPRARDNLKITASCRSFNFNGQPTTLSRGYLTLYRARHYKELPAYRGQNLRQEFRTYLLKSDMAERIPTYILAGSSKEAH